jgi:hypothetical protein
MVVVTGGEARRGTHSICYTFSYLSCSAISASAANSVLPLPDHDLPGAAGSDGGAYLRSPTPAFLGSDIISSVFCTYISAKISQPRTNTIGDCR